VGVTVSTAVGFRSSSRVQLASLTVSVPVMVSSRRVLSTPVKVSTGFATGTPGTGGGRAEVESIAGAEFDVERTSARSRVTVSLAAAESNNERA
jgi:hypothetical protein